jgi:hypothetical protein
MKRIAGILILAAMLLFAGPVAAGQPIDTIADDYNPSTGHGMALVWIEGGAYAYILYADNDGNGVYSVGDTILRQYLVRLLPL